MEEQEIISKPKTYRFCSQTIKLLSPPYFQFIFKMVELMTVTGMSILGFFWESTERNRAFHINVFIQRAWWFVHFEVYLNNCWYIQPQFCMNWILIIEQHSNVIAFVHYGLFNVVSDQELSFRHKITYGFVMLLIKCGWLKESHRC